MDMRVAWKQHLTGEPAPAAAHKTTTRNAIYCLRKYFFPFLFLNVFSLLGLFDSICSNISVGIITVHGMHEWYVCSSTQHRQRRTRRKQREKKIWKISHFVVVIVVGGGAKNLTRCASMRCVGQPQWQTNDQFKIQIAFSRIYRSFNFLLLFLAELFPSNFLIFHRIAIGNWLSPLCSVSAIAAAAATWFRCETF